MEFRKSSYSYWHGGCVEFRKSSRSGESACVEAAGCCGQVDVRDSKDPAGPVLSFSPAAWSAFVAAVKNGSCP